MEFLYEYGLFTAKTLTIVLSLVIGLILVISMASRNRDERDAHIEIRRLNEAYEDTKSVLKQFMANKQQAKQLQKEQKQKDKKEKKGNREKRPRVFVLDFHGDVKASAVSHLREEVSAVLMIAEDGDEVFVKLESAGGMVHGYGLAASQLQRLRHAKIFLTVSVDKVAASGGYMMACIADRIIAAPFAIVGSIGVVAQLPNFHRLLKKHDVDFELITGGEYKRTLTVFGENTDKARAKFKEDIDDTHELFKTFVKEHREVVDIAQVATGEHWFGRRALDLKLVDEIQTSDDYLLSKYQDHDLYQITHKSKKPLSSRIAGFAQGVADKLLLSWSTRHRERELL
ncbi:MAG: protease SohB [Gammaproteobacteria bacterium]|nr:protease SohB [Gammaproteobacteria bacterium]